MQILFIGHVTGDTKERESALDRSMMVSIEGLECFESEFNASLSGPSRRRGKFIVSSLYSGGHHDLQRSKSSISLSNVALNANPGTVLETARPEDSKTPPTC